VTFGEGDLVVHPLHGVGVIAGLKQRRWRNAVEKYYVIELIGGRKSSVMLPVSRAEEIGLRRVAGESELEEMWEVLNAESERLPKDHRTRFAQLEAKLNAGDMVQIAEILRDLASRRQRKGRLTTRSKRLYRRALHFLTAEIAAAEELDPEEAELRLRTALRRQDRATTIPAG
jgi:CarD family transcriptional regulator